MCGFLPATGVLPEFAGLRPVHIGFRETDIGSGAYSSINGDPNPSGDRRPRPAGSSADDHDDLDEPDEGGHANDIMAFLKLVFRKLAETQRQLAGRENWPQKAAKRAA